MNRHRMLLLLLCISIIGIATDAKGDNYYYFKGEQRHVAIDTNLISIRMQETYSVYEGWQLLQGQYQGMQYDASHQPVVETYGQFSLSDDINYDSIVSSIRSQSYVACVNPVISSGDSIKTFIGSTILCKFPQSIALDVKDSLLDAFNLIIEEEDVFYSGVSLLRLQENTDLSVLDIANRLFESGLVLYAQPDFYAPYTLASYPLQDVYYNESQTNIQRVVSIPGYENSAWEISTGDTTVTIAIIDQGIAPHEDYDTSAFNDWGFDFPRKEAAQFPLPENDWENHGMACAGLICGQHNNVVNGPNGEECYASTAGMAPNCCVIAERAFISILDSTYGEYHVDDAVIGGAIYLAKFSNAGVINCSWGRMDTTISEFVDGAIDDAFSQPRDGLGALLVFAAGNHSLYSDHSIHWPATKENVVAVGAITNNDALYSYSNYGPTLDLVAPSASGTNGDGIWTTDQMGMAGENPKYNDSCMPENDIDYRCTFGGTSAAAPLVTGTAALIMSRRPDLTAEQVIEVLKNSAVKDLDWGTITPELEDKYGAGRVNAFRALMAVWRGDVNNDGDRNIGDAVYMIQSIFQGGPAPIPHMAMADVNNDGHFNVGDPVFLITHIFKGGPAPELNYHYDY